MTTLPPGYPIKFCPVCKSQMFPKVSKRASGRIITESPKAFTERSTCGYSCGHQKAKLTAKVARKVNEMTKADFEFNPGSKKSPKAAKVLIITDEEYEARIDGILAKVLV